MARNVYRVCGLNLGSEVSFPELPSANGGKPECSFQLLSRRGPWPRPREWLLHYELPGGERWLSCGKGNGHYLLRFHELADFVVSREGERITCSSAPATPPETIRHLLLDQVLPLVLNLRGKEALHASAVLTPHGACAFLGEAGWGKSTLAASFVRSGGTALSDDCLMLDEDEGRILGVPSYPGVRLWPDSAAVLSGGPHSPPPMPHYTGKRRVDLDGRGPLAPVPLRGLYVLAPAVGQEAEGGAKIEPMAPGEGLMELVRHTFRLDLSDRAMLARQFVFLTRVVARVPVRRLSYPRDFSVLPAVQEAILRDLEGRSGGLG